MRTDPDPQLLMIAQRHQQQGLKTFKAARDLIEKQMEFSDSEWGKGEGRVKGDIHATAQMLERHIIPLLQSALSSYSAACWANSEAQHGSIWPCEAHKEQGFGKQDCGDCVRQTSVVREN